MSSKNKDLEIDPVMDFLEKTKEWIEKNKNLIFSAVAVAAVASLGYSGFSYMKSKKMEEAREAFGSASSLAITNQPDKAVEALKSVMDEYPGTVFESYSAFMAGNLLLQKEKYSEAEELLLVASKASKNAGFVKGEAIEGVGVCKEATGDIDGALEFYNKVLKDETATHRYPAVKWKIALIEKNKGNNETALKYCNEIVSDTTAKVFKSNAENLKAVIEAL